MFREWSSQSFSWFRLPRCATDREGSASPIWCCGCSVPSSEPKNYFIIYNLSHNSACVIWFHINFLVVIRIGLRCLSWGQHQHTSSRGGPGFNTVPSVLSSIDTQTIPVAPRVSQPSFALTLRCLAGTVFKWNLPFPTCYRHCYYTG